MNTADYILHEPAYDRQPSDPLAVLSAEIENMRVDEESFSVTERLLLLGRCIDWLDKSLQQGTVPDTQEARDTLDLWLCEECKLQSGEETDDEAEGPTQSSERLPSKRW